MRCKGDVLKFKTGATVVLMGDMASRYSGAEPVHIYRVMFLIGTDEHPQGSTEFMTEQLLNRADPVTILTANEVKEIERNLEHVIEEQQHMIDDLRLTIGRQARIFDGLPS